MAEESQDSGQVEVPMETHPRIGVIRDKSFWFYYPENLAQLKTLGVELVTVDSLEEKALPDLDALYIGGGFPETQAEGLARNRSFRDSLRRKIEEDLPVYAECGGLMYMGEALLLHGSVYPMVGVLPLRFKLDKKPQGHGYTILQVMGENPYFAVGGILKGHEFHYSKPVGGDSKRLSPVFRVLRGRGLDGKNDGLCRRNLLATYTHIHAAGNAFWGQRFFRTALAYKKLKKGD
jgi:cobyrinic acid a,c-diamide synthase